MPPPRFVLAGTHSGCGKTTVSIALMAALIRRGVAVQPFKAGPDCIDPAFHQFVTGRVSRNLDPWLLREEVLRSLFLRHAPRGDGVLSLIEGVMGLYDGIGTGPEGSTAHVAALLSAPVILVLNAAGQALSAAALVSGFASFAPGHPAMPDGAPAKIAGVILNRVSGPRHFALLRQSIEEHTGIPCLGYLSHKGAPALAHRALGLVPPQEQAGLGEAVSRLADAAQESIDLAALMRVARAAPPLAGKARAGSPTATPPTAPVHSARPLHIGLFRDEAFSFYYQDNLDWLEQAGARLHLCSPLRDPELPGNLDGLYIGGGFPEVFAEALEANASFRRSLCNALEAGLPAYAECGGMLYLCSSLRILPPRQDESSKSYSMTGFFPQAGEMTATLQPFGYVAVTLQQDCVLGPAGRSFRAHEFHYSRIVGTKNSPPPAYRAAKQDGRTWAGGLHKNNVLASYPRLHFYSCPEAPRSFLNVCAARRRAGDHRP